MKKKNENQSKIQNLGEILENSSFIELFNLHQPDCCQFASYRSEHIKWYLLEDYNQTPQLGRIDIWIKETPLLPSNFVSV